MSKLFEINETAILDPDEIIGFWRTMPDCWLVVLRNAPGQIQLTDEDAQILKEEIRRRREEAIANLRHYAQKKALEKQNATMRALLAEMVAQETSTVDVDNRQTDCCAFCGGWPLRHHPDYRFDHQPGCLYMKIRAFLAEHKEQPNG